MKDSDFAEFTQAKALLDMHNHEQETALSMIFRAYEHNIDYVHKVLVLTAGVIAFVPGLLARNGGNPVGLHRSLLWLYVAFAIGIVGLFVSRVYLIPVAAMLGQARTAFNKAFAEATDDDAFGRVATGYNASAAYISSKRKMLTRWVLVQVILESSFFLAFLTGLWNLYRGYGQ